MKRQKISCFPRGIKYALNNFFSPPISSTLKAYETNIYRINKNLFRVRRIPNICFTRNTINSSPQNSVSGHYICKALMDDYDVCV